LLQAVPELLEQRQWLNGKIGQASYTELEIEQRLQQMGGNAIDGRAFFYFRDPAWRNPRADAGEPGWRSDYPADRQKLELLRERIRTSGYPLVQGLEHQPAGAPQRGCQAPHPRRRHLSQRRSHHPSGGGSAAGAGRALAARGPAHVL
jgi:hypothetical protein